MANFFARNLIDWHLNNPRPLPWSDHPAEPYYIWLSEIIMQQTRIEQGAAYYHRFVNRFPTVADLASASMDEVMRLWEGLGYYSRARNLHKTAKMVSEDFNNIFPQSYDGLLALPGIGPYSAAAISSFSYGHRNVVVDGNVKRVISRFAGILEFIDDASVHERIRQIAFDYMKGSPSAVFNQAIMNFGALVCKPKSPLCDICPLSARCYAYQYNLVSSIPFRTKKKESKTRYFNFLMLHYRSKILLVRRNEKDIWNGLYTPPLIESKSNRHPNSTKVISVVQQLIGHSDFDTDGVSSFTKQQLTHQILFGRFIHLNLLSPPAFKNDNHVWVSRKTVTLFGKPRMITDILEHFFKSKPAKGKQ